MNSMRVFHGLDEELVKTPFTEGSSAFVHGGGVLHLATRAEPETIADRDPERARAAHLLRRTAMSATPHRVAELASLSWADAVLDVLTTAETSSRANAGNLRPVPRHEDWGDVALWWVREMSAPGTGLHDRMAWFWHGLLTTNAWKVDGGELVADQLAVLRDNAVGNFRTLLQQFVGSGALLQYLDAAGSAASNPNENLARELMELFTIGRGQYHQDDVRSAARALAGWRVDEQEVIFDRSRAFIAPLVYLGEQADWDTEMVVDRLCDHPATATRIGSRLWSDLVGGPPEPAVAADLGALWQAADLEILPLVERILTSREFAAARLNRPRTGLEWFLAAAVATGTEPEDIWQLEILGQAPYLPPNVAGWPTGDRWLSPGSLLVRASVAHSLDIAPNRRTSTGDLLDACAIHAVSPSTVAAIDAVSAIEDLSPDGAELARWRLALTSPEFNLA